MLTELKIKDIIKWAQENKLGNVEKINLNKNYNQGDIKNSYNIEIVIKTQKGTRSYTFSEHGLANINDGKKSLYAVDSESTFSAENAELHPITYSWVKFMGMQGIAGYNESEIEYRKAEHAKIDELRKRYSALKSYYTSEVRKLEETGINNNKNYNMIAKELELYTRLVDNCSKLKQLQTKCIKTLEAQLQNQ